MKTEKADYGKRWYPSKNNNAWYHIKEDQEFNSQQRETRELNVLASGTTQIINFATMDTAILVVQAARLTRIIAKQC
jgi:hypothetical protein